MEISPEELTLKPETLELAVQQVKMNGYVIFEAVLPLDFVTELHDAFIRVFESHTAQNCPNRGPNRWQMHLPFMTPFIDPRIITNPVALAVVNALLGDDCVCHYFASDTPKPGSDYQSIHSDIHLLFPETDLALPAYSLVLNIPLVDFRGDNGPLEIWPGGTHLMPSELNKEKLGALMQSERILMPAGSLLIRDARMWHRGTPNCSDAPRPDMAFIYSRHWMKTSYPRIGIPRETYDGLSERAKRLYRLEDIGGRLVNAPDV